MGLCTAPRPFKGTVSVSKSKSTVGLKILRALGGNPRVRDVPNPQVSKVSRVGKRRRPIKYPAEEKKNL